MKILFPAIAVAGLTLAINRPPDIPFQVHMLDGGANEACAIADVNGDKRPDLISGENWFEGPSWKRHHFRELPYTSNYIDDFSDLPLDINGDGRIDVISVSWFSKKISWWENPGKSEAQWQEHPVESGSPVEFAFLVDLNNDGKAEELLPQFGDTKTPLAWYEVKNGALAKHVVSSKSYGHGIGAGDVNKDGRADILTPEGWLEAPADPRKGDWTMHAGFPKGTQFGFMHVLDVNGDGRNDVVTSHAHDYGIFWFEQGADGNWTKRVIDESWSQAHAVTIADLNGDGRPDIVTGKRYMAHNGKDPGEREPLGLYWYEQIPTGDPKRIEWARHVIDYGSRAGAGMQVRVGDLDGDGDPDIAVGGKSGLFLFENLTKKSGSSAKRTPTASRSGT